MLEKARSHATLYPILAVFACTGMRPEELRVLEWKNLDWENCEIEITNAAVTKRDNQSVLGGRGKAYEEVGEDVMGRDSEYIFFSRGGGFLTNDVLTERWKKFVKSNGYSGKNYILYRFRHTVGTTLSLEGKSSSCIATFLGDSSTDMVEEHYINIKGRTAADECRGIMK
jgi:integrase